MGQGTPGGMNRQSGDRKNDGEKKEKKFEPAAPPSRVGRKQRKQKGPEAAARVPTVTPLTKCKLRLLKLERIKDYLLMEEEFVANQERLKPQEEKTEEDRSKVDDLRGSPMSVGNLEELIDENHAIVSSSVGPEYYVGILSFVDKDQLEPGCAILMHNKVLSVVGLLQDDVDPMVSVMKTIMVMIREVQKQSMNEKDYTICQIISFEEEKLEILHTLSINMAKKNITKMFLEWLEIDDSHPFTFEYTNYKDKVLVDWPKLKPEIASAPVWLQKGPTCWAHAIAAWLEKNFIIFKEEGEEEVRVSPMDLIDWVYSMEELYLDNPKNNPDKSVNFLGTYGCNIKRAVKYAIENGVALLANYEVKIEKRKLEFTRKDTVAFEEMRKARGPRVFPQNVHFEHNLNLEVMVKNLNFGVLVGSIKTCKGCQYCQRRRFVDYKGTGVYSMPKHPSQKEKDFGRHTVLIVGAGNKKGVDYVHIINSHGTQWGNNGEGDIDIKLFVVVVRLGGIGIKSWNEKEWI